MSLQYIIDGYNILHHPLLARTAAHKHTQEPQQALIKFININRLAGSSKNKVTVVFDGYPKDSFVSGNSVSVSIIFSRRISADEKIKMLVEEAANRKNIVVVSDDKEIMFVVKALGANHLGAAEFLSLGQKHKNSESQDNAEPGLTYSQMHKINEELRRLWLE